MFIAALVTIAKIWNQSKCPLTGEWINKRCCAVLIYIYMYIYTHTHTGIVHIHKKDEVMPFAATLTDLQMFILI